MKNPIVTFEMENGKVFKAELYPEIAPNTVKKTTTKFLIDNFFIFPFL